MTVEPDYQNMGPSHKQLTRKAHCQPSKGSKTSKTMAPDEDQILKHMILWGGGAGVEGNFTFHL